MKEQFCQAQQPRPLSALNSITLLPQCIVPRVLLKHTITTENYFLCPPFQLHSQDPIPYRHKVYYFIAALYCAQCSSGTYYHHRKIIPSVTHSSYILSPPSLPP
jgi:hypothetical protein